MVKQVVAVAQPAGVDALASSGARSKEAVPSVVLGAGGVGGNT